MSFTLLVHLQTQHTNTARLNVARDLADRLDAVVLGAAASIRGLLPALRAPIQLM